MNEELENKVLQAICENDQVYILRLLEKIDINTRLKSEDNDTLLTYSISDQDSDIYKLFKERGADLSLQNDLGETLLHSAIYSGKLERVIEVLDTNRLNKKSNDGTSPLLLAIGLENESVANYLIDQGADINSSDNESNRPIHLASYFGMTSVVRNLIINKAHINIKTEKGNLPLALAVNEGHRDIIDILYKQMYK